MIAMIFDTSCVILGSFGGTSWIGLPVVVVSIQLVLIAATGFWMTLRFSGENDEAAHRIWLTAITLALILLPVHLLLGGWPIRIPSPSSDGRTARVAADVATDPDARADAFTVPGMFSTQPNEIQPTPAVGTDQPVGKTLPTDTVTRAREPSPSMTRVNRTRGRVAFQESRPDFVYRVLSWLRHRVMLAAVFVYLSGCLVLMLRLVIGALRLRCWFRGGHELSESVHQEARSSADAIGLSRTPLVRVIEQSSMPLVFGCLRPVVLVPSGFESWPQQERRATLMHEFMHIHRRDLIGQLISQCMCVAYWFHPAAWFMNRRLSEAREWATDCQLVDGKIDPRQYAETLLNILSRTDPGRAPTPGIGSGAIAMSSPVAIEDRLRRLLQSSPPRSAPLRFSGKIAIVLLPLLLAVTTVRIEQVTAQTDATATETADQKSTTENDLFARIRDCDVLTVTGDQFDAIFTVDGTVLSDAGQPVAGAIVLLRESSTARLSSERDKYLHHENYPLVRTPDVFARTVTDTTGRFEFRNVKSPSLPKAWSNSWRGNVVAAHQERGIGWLAMGDKNEKRRVDSGITIVLKPTASIEGNYLSQDEVGINAATAHLDRLVKPNAGPTEAADFDLQMSQLTPHAKTDKDGLFTFKRIPKGLIALAGVSDDGDHIGGSAAIATSQEVPLGVQSDEFSQVYGDEVVPTPALITADAGVLVSGNVRDENGRPVSETNVSFASTSIRDTTESDGRFEIRIPSRWIQREQGRGNAKMRLHAAPKTESSLLSTYCEVSIDDLLAGKPVSIDLQAGAVVRGRVVTEDGQPIADASVRPLTPSKMFGARTEADGTFQFVAPVGHQIVIVTTSDAGYSVPSRTQFYSATENDVSGWPQQSIELRARTPVEIPPIVVTRVRPLQIIVSLPDGEPAKGATAIIKDEIAQKIPADSRFVRPPRIIDQSEPVMTDPIGRAELFPKGKLTDRAKVHVKLSTPDKAFDAQIPISVAVDGVLKVILQPGALLEGRVLIDGQPVAGAKVSIGESTPLRASGSGGYPMGFQVSNHIQAMTDRDGWYRAAVSRDKVYSVSIQSMPNDSARPGIGYQPAIVVDGKLRVRDFAFYRGDREIAGRVVDRRGAPIPGANVQILRSASASPDFWINHMRDSQFDTDQLGRFHLKHVPAGTYPLRISGPRNESTRDRVATMMTVEAGTTGVEIALDMRPVETIPRLQPVRIVPIETSGPAP